MPDKQIIINGLDSDWRTSLSDVLNSKSFDSLANFLEKENKSKTIFPKQEEWFKALNLTPLEKVKVVILGQDPYHGSGQANGLAFSVNQGIKLPPSLKNIFKELARDCDLAIPIHGDLSSWAEQGVLLLNTCLTVEEGKAGSHHKKGWESFTNSVIQKINQRNSFVVFLLWGNKAQEKSSLIDQEKHVILEAPHPSPLSAYHGFHGCGHFSKTNQLLLSKKMKPIDWEIK